MTENNPIRVFVTHAFSESDDYLRVFEFLESVDHFFYLNVSRPEDAPKTNSMDEAKDILIQQIKAAEAMILLPSLYDSKPDLMNFMMDGGKAAGKPMIVVRPFGGLAETPQELVDRANEHIKWNARDIADSLRRQARLEDTNRWDTIDFPGYDADGEVK